jgi:hypothetical protein
MDHECLDDLTRLVAGASAPRRAVWQPLLGGAPGMVVLRLGPTKGVVAPSPFLCHTGRAHRGGGFEQCGGSHPPGDSSSAIDPYVACKRIR